MTLKILMDMIRATEGKACINGIPVHENKRSPFPHFGDSGYVSWL